MYKVVLVDDEPSVIDGLRIFVDWEQKGFAIAGQASDGAAAYPIIQEIRPDLIICDIHMPGLNGLELFEKVNACIRPVPKFIILSGYNDFSYAQKALQFGALGYLTKPLDAEELENELIHAAGIMESEKRAALENLELIRLTACQLYNDILDGKRNEKLSRKVRFLFDIHENAPIHIVQFITDTVREGRNYPDMKIYDLLMKITGTQNESSVFYNGNGSYTVVMQEGAPGPAGHTGIEEQVSQRLGNTDPADYGYHAFWVLIGGVSGMEVLEGIQTCGRQLGQLHTYCMLRPEKKVVCYDTLQKKPCTEIHFPGTVFPELPFERIVNMLKGNDANKVSYAVDEFFRELDKNVYSSSLCSIALYRLADVLRKMAYSCGIEADRVIKNFTESIENRSPACKKHAMDMCIAIFEKLNSTNTKPLVFLEDEIIDYIKANYRNCLSLQQIAEKFSLSAIIISKIVRKKTGLKFNNYFNSLRIEYAKTLFASADMKVTAVCEESGYSDNSYFVEKFREFTGVSPSEYKKKYS